MKKILFLLLPILAFLPLLSLAANPFDIVINEICWMGNKVSANDEWIELYNNTDLDIDLDGWKLIAKDGTPEIILKGKVDAKGFFLLERTDDDSAPDAPADQIYKGALNNEGEFLQLIDGQGNIIDEVDCSKGWFSGDNKTKQTMERISFTKEGSDERNWRTSKESDGTPKAQNTKGAEEDIEVKPAQAQEDAEAITEVESLPISYPGGIVINEILPSPEGPDAENEYIEIFNQNDFEVDILGWSLQDIEGKTKTFALSKGTKIKAKDFLVFLRPQTKITLNNSGDGLKLLNPNGKIVDEVYFEKALQGESFNRIDNNWIWSSNLTPGRPNTALLPGNEQVLPDNAQELKEIKSEELTASIFEIVTEKTQKIYKDFFLIFSIALVLAVSSGISILFLKKRLKK